MQSAPISSMAVASRARRTTPGARGQQQQQRCPDENQLQGAYSISDCAEGWSLISSTACSDGAPPDLVEQLKKKAEFTELPQQVHSFLMGRSMSCVPCGSLPCAGHNDLILSEGCAACTVPGWQSLGATKLQIVASCSGLPWWSCAGRAQPRCQPVFSRPFGSMRRAPRSCYCPPSSAPAPQSICSSSCGDMTG